MSEALRPPEETDDWLGQIKNLRAEGPGRDPIAEGLEGLSVIAARNEEEAARIAALIMREALETPGRTCALVTPDQALARRVSARLSRWSVKVDASAGAPLALAPVAVLLGLVARTAADPLDPVSLLAILKHPLVRLGLPADDFNRGRRTLEREALRGARAHDWASLEARLEPKPAAGGSPASPERIAALAAAKDLLGRLDAGLTFARAPLDIGRRQRGAGCKWLGAGARSPGQERRWRRRRPLGRAAGERGARALLASLIGESDGLPPVTRARVRRTARRPPGGELVRAGGADPSASEDPRRPGSASDQRRPPHPRRPGGRRLAASRAARSVPFAADARELGLPPPERRIGLSAHDFAQAAAAPEVVLLHADRRGGARRCQSRWLWRLRDLANGADVALPSRPEVLAWARALDAPLVAPPPSLATAPRPRARPPVEARPRRTAVTGVELWLRDPYAIYARDILKLRPLERPDEPVGRARARHGDPRGLRALRERPSRRTAATSAAFAAILERRAGRRRHAESQRMARERALAANVAPWVIAFERAPPAGRDAVHVERRGELTFDDRPAAPSPSPPGPTASRRAAATGRHPRLQDRPAAQRQAGARRLSPRSSPLPPPSSPPAASPPWAERRPGELIYVRLSGGRVPGEEPSRPRRRERRSRRPGPGRLQAPVGRSVRSSRDRPTFPGPSRSSWSRWGGDYDHLARVWEWHVMGDDEDEA